MRDIGLQHHRLTMKTRSTSGRLMFLRWSTRSVSSRVRGRVPGRSRLRGCCIYVRQEGGTGVPLGRPVSPLEQDGPSSRFARRVTLSQIASWVVPSPVPSPELGCLDPTGSTEGTPENGAPSDALATSAVPTDSSPEFLVHVRPRILHCYGFSGLSAYGGCRSKLDGSDGHARLRRVGVSTFAKAVVHSAAARHEQPEMKLSNALLHRRALLLSVIPTQGSTCANPPTT